MTLIRKKCIEENGNVFCAFVDYKKAFDVVDRDLMVTRLEDSGVNGKMLELIRGMYSGTSNLLRINGELTEEFPSKNSVLQGNNLSSTIFSLFINSLLKELKRDSHGIRINNGRNINCLAYADDIVIMAMTEEGLQSLLNVIWKWCRSWRMIVNCDKTKVVHFRKQARKLADVDFTIGGIKLEKVKQYKYLRTILTRNLDSGVIEEQLAAASSRALSQIIGKTRSNFDLGFKTYETLVAAGVNPVMDYKCSMEFGTAVQ